MKRLAAAVLVALAAAAPAAAGVRISGVDVSGYPEVRVIVVATAQPQIVENGARVVGAQAANLGRSKSVVLAVDHSQSMRGRSLRDATAAAREFVRSKSSGDRIQVIGFGL